MTDNVTLYHGDCLEVMKQIPDKSISAVICDLPYGTTDCKWDVVIPFEKLWEQYNRVCKSNAVIALFGNEPFTSLLVCSNLKWFKYRLDWDKVVPSGFTYARFRPMQQTEDVAIFSVGGGKTAYNPQMKKREKPIKSGGNSVSTTIYNVNGIVNGTEYVKTYEHKFPTTLMRFMKIRQGSLHPTQKPVDLLRYLIRTYSNEGDTILDNTMGSGSTGVAAVMENRKFIGIEKDDSYFNIAQKRINEAIIKKSSEIQFE